MFTSRHRRILFFACTVATALSISSPARAQPPQAATVANEQSKQKGLLLSFISYNTVESKMAHDQLAADPAVKALSEKHFMLTTYVEGRDIVPTARYQVIKYPTLIATQADGTEIDRLVGYTRSSETLAFLESASKGQSGLAALVEKNSSADALFEDRLKLADALIKRGKYTDATRELTTSLERSSAPTAKDERKYLKMILARLASLGEREPSALEAIRARRDALEKSLSPHFPEPMTVVFAFNEALKQPERNVDLYLRLPVESPLRERLFPAIFIPLVAKQKYQEANDSVDLESFVNSAYPKQAPKPSAAKVGVPPSGHAHADHSQRIIELTVAAVETTLGTGQLEKAKRLAGRAMDAFTDKSLAPRLELASSRAATPAAQEFTTWLATISPASNPATSATVTP
jgi:hypothetical protein